MLYMHREAKIQETKAALLLKSEFPTGSRGNLQLPGSMGGHATIPIANLYEE